MRAVAVLAAVVVATSASVAPALAAPGITRTEVLDRAASWLTANNRGPVPYSQTSHWHDGYRQDCSGYVSMAAKLGAPGPNTVELGKTATWTIPIEPANMLPGDLMVDSDGDGNSRHVVIFHQWSNAGKSAYLAYEQRGCCGTTHRALTYGLFGHDEYKARRLKNIAGW